MKATFLQVKAVTDTLPIGFYTNRKIEAVLTEDTDSSWYDPLRDTINISYKQLTEGIERITEDKFEMVIRSNHYHEVAHAMLTPKDLPCPSWFNIFEDERIERVTANLFYGIDFAEAFNAICGEMSTPATSPEHAFFNLVRYHHGAKKWLKKVDSIIKKHKTVHRNSGEECGEYWSNRASDYYHAVEDLWNEFCEEWHKDPKKAEGDREGEEAKADGKGKSGAKGYKGDIKETPEDSEDEAEGGTSEGEEAEAKSGATSTEDSKSKKRSTSAIMSAEDMKAIMSTVADSMMNPEFYQTASMLFENFHRKNSKGSGINGYSGVLNPRLADRPDYRMFERSVSARGNNSFGTFHLNLYIDTSGSFMSNDEATNKIIKSLELIEQKNRNFTFDVVTMGKEEKISPKSDRFIKSGGGNHLSGEIFDIYRKMQLPQTYNYNIVLFDGDAYSNDVYKARVKKWLPDGKGFQAFNNNNCMIISDPTNKKYVDKYAPTVKTIYTHNYVAELTDNVMKALQNALI